MAENASHQTEPLTGLRGLSGLRGRTGLRGLSGLTGVTDCASAPVTEPQWHVLWTRSHFEQRVHDQLSAKGFESFLPKVGQWSRCKGLRHLTRVPMFPGYLFLHHAIDKVSYLEVCKTKGLVRILGERWDRLGIVPDRQVEALQMIAEADLPALPHPYLHEGQRVRVVHGPLASAEGILMKSDPKEGLLVLSVELLRRSVVVQIDCTQVIPV